MIIIFIKNLQLILFIINCSHADLITLLPSFLLVFISTDGAERGKLL